MITFRVYGIPQTKGSAKAFMRPGMRFPVVTNDNTKNKGWATTIRAVAQSCRQKAGLSTLLDGPVCLSLHFILPRPKSLVRKLDAPMIKRPDLDKMTRSIKDALEGVFYKNDSQVNEAHLYKAYGDEPGVVVQLKKGGERNGESEWSGEGEFQESRESERCNGAQEDADRRGCATPGAVSS